MIYGKEYRKYKERSKILKVTIIITRLMDHLGVQDVVNIWATALPSDIFQKEGLIDQKARTMCI